MNKKAKLSPSMSLAEFDNGYWYAVQLKAFAKTLGISGASKLRKDEIERAIRLFLKTGKIRNPRPLRTTPTDRAVRDIDRGLRLDLPVVVYTSNKETKSFLEREAKNIAPHLKRRSGARYRLNRWRDAQLENRVRITYRDLVREYVRLNESQEPFTRIPSGRYINFLSDFLANEKGATRTNALKAWATLKTLNVPKDYPSWVKVRERKRS